MANRFIPAWAGNTTILGGTVAARSASTVHPRVGGEHCYGRARFVHRRHVRFIPAWAGNTATNLPVHRRYALSGSSPRGRGTRTRARLMSRVFPNRFIPAWAGNTM